jgi:SlyX protein
MNDERLEQLEIKMTFLENATNELSEVVYRQQREIDALTERLQVLATRLEALKSDERPYTAEEERPPHY